MNREYILRIADSVMKNIHRVDDNIYRGELNIFSAYPAGVCYIDMTDAVPYDHFNDYQEKLLADDFYNTPGALQWNYYLFLLQDSDKIDTTTKSKIEKDDKYARKYVFNEAEFEDFFKLETSTAGVTGNIVLEWKKKLDAAGLWDVYRKKSYTSAVADFINNQPAASKTPIVTTSVASNPPRLDYINKIVLHDNYRDYPKVRSFVFGKVNLFKGVNGVGKTSVFEAIELMACGKNLRNYGKKEPDNCIEGFINNNVMLEEKCTPSKAEKYRARDSFWYSNEYATGNATAASFNRFNFFNTDAANNFMNSHKEAQVREALYNLILGPEFTYIRERMEGFRDRIKPEYNKIKSQVDNAAIQQTEAKSAIDRLKDSGAVKVFKEHVMEGIRAQQFVDSNIMVGDETVLLEQVINELSSLLEVFTTDELRTVQSNADLAAQKTKLEEKQKKFETFVTNQQQIMQQLQIKSEVINALRTREQLLSEALKYFIDVRSFSLPGLAGRLKANEQRIKAIAAAKKGLENVRLESFSSSNAFETVVSENKKGLNDAREELQQVETSLREALGKLQRISQLVTQIKSLGKEYLASDSQPHTCPLCDTDFKPQELIDRINRELSVPGEDNKAVETLILRESRLREIIDRQTKQELELSALRIAHSTLNNKATDETMTLSAIVLDIHLFLQQENELSEERTNLMAIAEWAQTHLFSEEEFSAIAQQITALQDPALALSFDNKTAFVSARQVAADSLQIILGEADELKQQQANLSRQLKSDLGLSLEREYLSSEVKELLAAEERKLATWEQTIGAIQKIVRLDDEETMDGISLKLSILKKNIDSLKKERQNQTELERAESTMRAATDFLAKNQGNAQRIKVGLELLTELSSLSAVAELESFFSQNLNEINDIFRTLHAPREFTGIKFESGELSLLHHSGTVRKITEISTGQRAALAISMFISLNRKLRNGPGIILFDDPVSHIDDLNILSFIDFLRFFILKEGKQIFLATANARLAALIEKKFQFLGEDFKTWELIR